jgi:hypothetical protein
MAGTLPLSGSRLPDAVIASRYAGRSDLALDIQQPPSRVPERCRRN